jgi:N6-adenosine-specific RNA methylase IME4
VKDLPSGPFTTVVADPPWPYGDALPGPGRGAKKHYVLMSLDDISMMGIQLLDTVEENAHLYLWTTNAFVAESWQVAKDWGFVPKTICTWVKSKNIHREGTKLILGNNEGLGLWEGSERWLPVVGFDGYEVSNYGRVRKVERKQNTRGTGEWEVLAEKEGHGGYLRVVLIKNGKRCDGYVHQLVAEAFFSRPSGKVVDHIDADKWNNDAWNLQYLTGGDNTRKSQKGRWKGVRNEARIQIGMGHSFRNVTEHLIFAVRGKLDVKRHDVPSVLFAPRREHSEKPDEAYELVESMSPGPYLELFARRPWKGWSAWGNEVDWQQEPEAHKIKHTSATRAIRQTEKDYSGRDPDDD